MVVNYREQYFSLKSIPKGNATIYINGILLCLRVFNLLDCIYIAFILFSDVFTEMNNIRFHVKFKYYSTFSFSLLSEMYSGKYFT